MPSLSKVYKQFEVTAGDNRQVSGYANVFHFLDWQNEIVAPGAWSHDIPRFVSKGFVGGLMHDHKNPIGKPVKLYEDAKGLFMDAILDDSDEARHAFGKIKNRIVQHFSVGVVPLQARRLNERQINDYWAKAGWKPSEEERLRAADPDGATLILKARILEVSPVALPANDLAEIVSYKSFGSGLEELRRRVESIEQRLAGSQVVPAEDDYGKLLDSFEFIGDR